MKVLLVEDEEFIRDLFKRQLDLSGFTTDAFANGQDGLAAIAKNAYDLVLLDIMLPDINGLQILQNIRSNPATKTIAVILLTNLGQDAVIKQGFELGADGYLVKAAYTPDQIVQEVKNIMQRKNASKPVAAPATPPADMPPLPTANPAPADTTPMPAFPGQAPQPAAPASEMPSFPGQAPANPSPTPDPLAAPTPPATPEPMAPAADPMAAQASTTPPAAPADPMATSAPVTPPATADISASATPPSDSTSGNS